MFCIFRLSFYRTTRAMQPSINLLGDNIFDSNPTMECCPTATSLSLKYTAVNRDGILLELFNTVNQTQSFYKTYCRSEVKLRPCRFIDRKYTTRCMQQYSYVYAVGRTFGQHMEQFRLEHIRVETGCKCVRYQ